MIETSHDKYGGVIVDHASLPEQKDEFTKEIVDLIETSSDKKLIWIKLPINKSDYIPFLTKLNFEFHHCDETNIMLIRKLKPNALVPTTKNYIVGVGAIVFHHDQLLVIKDRFSVGYKLPGGHIDKNESIKAAVKREVYEETGVDIEFESILNLGHFNHGQFGESNLYIACTAKTLSTDIEIHDSEEIVEARWIDVNEFLNSEDVHNYNKRIVEAAIHNGELKLTAQEVELRTTTGEVFF